MPEARRRHEGHPCVAVQADRIDDLPVRVDLAAEQRVAAGAASGDEVERDRLVPVRRLHRAGLHIPYMAQITWVMVRSSGKCLLASAPRCSCERRPPDSWRPTSARA